MQTVGILGGMGPAAGADFARLFVQACAQQMRALGLPVTDQGFPEHWLAQVPVPDRMLALREAASGITLGSQQPLDPMLQALGRLAALGARTVAIACNTAHAWHAALQARFPQIEVLHVAQEVTAHLVATGVTQVALLATEGTYRTGLYQTALNQAGIACINPTPEEQKILTQGIFNGVKAGNLPLAQSCFAQVAIQLTQRHGALPLILGCTEIPLGLAGVASVAQLQLIDPSEVLAQALAQRAYRE